MNTLPAFSHEVDADIVCTLTELTPRWTPLNVNDESQSRQGDIGLLCNCGLIQAKRSIEATTDALPGIFRAVVRVFGNCDDIGTSRGPLWRALQSILPKNWVMCPTAVRLAIRGAHELRLTTNGERAALDIRDGEQWKVLALAVSNLKCNRGLKNEPRKLAWEKTLLGGSNREKFTKLPLGTESQRWHIILRPKSAIA